MHILDAAQMRAWDEYTIANEPISSIDLMERAASACFTWLRHNDYLHKSFAIFCGPGNNGGDGLALARMLLNERIPIKVYVLTSDKGYSKDCKTNLDLLIASGTEVTFITKPDSIPRIIHEPVVIDALYGTGLNHPLSGLPAQLINALNSSGREIISIDMPSGLYTDKTSANNIAVKATHTLTFQALKPALLIAENGEHFNEVHVLDIGLLPSFPLHPKYFWLSKKLIKTIYKPRNAFSHKGDHGHAALITGSIGMMGAATLCAAGCMRSGVGKLTCFVPRIGYEIMQTAVPEAMAFISGEDHITQYEPAFDPQAIGIGPGIGNEFSATLLENIFANFSSPLLLDADALTLLSRKPALINKIPKGAVLTPHPKEFDRLFGTQANDFERIETCLSQAKELQLVIVLKGHHTFIALPDGNAYFNSTGNAGMASGGSGDVLAGIITGLMAQGYSSSHAALLGVYLHGLAGDLAAKELSQEAMIAGDIVDYLTKAFLILTAK